MKRSPKGPQTGRGMELRTGQEKFSSWMVLYKVDTIPLQMPLWEGGDRVVKGSLVAKKKKVLIEMEAVCRCTLFPAKSGKPLCADALVCFMQRCFWAQVQQHANYLCFPLWSRNHAGHPNPLMGICRSSRHERPSKSHPPTLIGRAQSPSPWL